MKIVYENVEWMHQSYILHNARPWKSTVTQPVALRLETTTPKENTGDHTYVGRGGQR